MRIQPARTTVLIAIILGIVAQGFAQSASSTQTIAQQSGGYVPQTYQPRPRLETPPPPYGPEPEVVTRSQYHLVPAAPEGVINVDPKTAQGSALLAPQDFFGRVSNPPLEYYDPFNSSLSVDGHPTAPGDHPVLPEQVADVEINPFSFAEVNVAEDMWVTIVLLREGEIVYPKARLPGSEKIVMIERMPDSNSPYIFLRGAALKTDYSMKNPARTSLDLEVEDRDHHAFDYKLNVRLVPKNDPSLKPFVRINLVHSEMPPVYGQAGSRFSDETAPITRAGSEQQLFAAAPASSGGVGAPPNFEDGHKFTRDEARKYGMIMIAMANSYLDGVRAKAKGYGTDKIIWFRPATVKDGKITGKTEVPAFRNPFDGQLYFLINGYWFPKYHAILYELSYKNTSDRPIYWNYSLLRITPGLEPTSLKVKPTFVSPDKEQTNAGEVNTLWVLCQGTGWEPDTAVRFHFPPPGVDGTIKRLILPDGNDQNSGDRSKDWSLLR